MQDFKTVPYPYWDKKSGWGHVITPPDHWRGMKIFNGTEWDWYGATADQGFLYYWTKYVKKSVSLVIKDDVEQWEMEHDGSLKMQELVRGKLKEYGCSVGKSRSYMPSPYLDFIHFTGGSKPWHQNVTVLNEGIRGKNFEDCTGKQKWYWSLLEALEDIGMSEKVSLDFILGHRESPAVGISTSAIQRSLHIHWRLQNEWRKYENLEDEPEFVQEHVQQLAAQNSL
mmetsp:Transcript_5084/g.9472  ORF Transcript_5084/g.9472 Transcript_5084/m.9472 type:complete len:226 (-) Transcript_5084:83-760(-)